MGVDYEVDLMKYTDLSETFEKAIERDGGTVDRITSRACGNDRYNGVDYSFYGEAITVMPIIDVVAQVDEYGIAEITHFDEHFDGEPHLSVFVAYTPRPDYPAFAP